MTGRRFGRNGGPALVRSLHAWAGVLLSLLLFTLAASGTLLLFKDDWTRATVPGAGAGAPATAEAAGRAMVRAQAAFPGQVRSINLARPDLGVHTVALKEGGAFLSAGGQAEEVIARWPKNGRAADWLFDLHHHLFWGKTGEQVAGWAGAAAMVMVATGVALWWPQRRAFSGRVVPSSNTRPGWLAAHRNLGVIAAPVLLVILCTGTGMALPDPSRPLLASLLGGGPELKPTGRGPARPVDWPAVTRAAQARFPDGTLRILITPKTPGAPVEVRLRRPGEWNANGRTRVWLDARGTVLAAADALSAPGGTQAFNGLLPLHAAKVGGRAYQLVIALGGLSLALLAVYGAESYRRKLMRLNAPGRREGRGDERPPRGAVAETG